MITFSQVPLSEIELGRMDAEYYRPAFMSLSKSISDKPNVSIERAGAIIDCSAFYPSIVPHYKFDQVGTPFLRVNEIQNGLLSISESTVFLPKNILSLNHSTIAVCQPGDLIIAKGGNSLGKVALLTKLYPEYSVCRDVLIVRTQNLFKINRFFLWMYLHSKIGQALLIRTASQTGQPHLTIDSVAKLKIPLIPDVEQDKIQVSYLAAEAAMELSREAYHRANQVLEAELGLDKMRFDRSMAFEARFSLPRLAETFGAKRVDAQCFSPEAVFYEHLLAKSGRCDRLGNLLFSVAKGRQQAETDAGSMDYCSIKHISGLEIIGAAKALPGKGAPIAKSDDLLLAITGATIGKIGIVKRYEELLFSGDMLRLRTNAGINPHYLLLVLNHHLGQVQFNRWITGSTNGHLAPRDVRRMLVPRISQEKEGEIAVLAEESLGQRQESEKLLEQAKARVEQLIEEAVQA